jgi:hypothetical protein
MTPQPQEEKYPLCKPNGFFWGWAPAWAGPSLQTREGVWERRAAATRIGQLG